MATNDFQGIPTVLNNWPGPIAHVYKRTLDDLAATITNPYAATSAMMIFKDLVEVMTVLPCVIMLRDLATSRPHSKAVSEFRALFYSKPLSLGDWNRSADALAKEIAAGPEDDFVAPEIAKLFRIRPPQGNPKSTAFGSRLRALVQWRNEKIGHAPHLRDQSEILKEVTKEFADFNKELDGVRDVWTDITLRAEHSDMPLRGHDVMCSHRECAVPVSRKTSEEERDSLVVVRGTRPPLDLSPYVGLRRCPVCEKRDLFIFSSRKPGETPKYYYFDYFAGHQAKDARLDSEQSEWTREIASAKQTPEAAITKQIEDSSSIRDNYIGIDTFKKLANSIRVEDEYVAPDYLHDWIRAFPREHDHGILCLRAPAHSGKSVFSQAGQLQKAIESTWGDPHVCTMHIRRDFNFGMGQWDSFIQQEFIGKALMKLSQRGLPWTTRPNMDPKEAMLELLSGLDSLRGGRHILLCLDGLDELPDPGTERSIIDFIPPANQLPDGFFLLLTCRPKAETPDWVERRLESILTDADGNDAEDVSTFRGGGDEAGYRKLLRTFFDDRLSEFFEARSTSEDGRDALFDKIVDLADKTFLYVSLLVSLLADEIIAPEGLNTLGRGPGLIKAYLDGLRRTLGERQMGLIERVLAVLAAAEEAHMEDTRLQPPGFAEPEWHGLSMDVLSELLDELWTETGGPGSFRLLFSLQTIRNGLRSWQGDASSTSRYRLGLKTMLQSMRDDSRWSELIDATHRRLAETFLLEWGGRFSEINSSQPEAEYMLRFVVPHSRACKLQDVVDGVEAGEGLVSSFSARAENAKTRNQRDAVGWYSLQIVCSGLAGVSNDGKTEVLEDMAYLFGTRGSLLADLGYHSFGAGTDLYRATDIIEELQSRRGLENIREDIRAMIPQVLECCQPKPSSFFPLLESVLSQSRLDGDRSSLLHLLWVKTQATGLNGNCDFVRSIEAAREFIHVLGKHSPIDEGHTLEVYAALWDASDRIGDSVGVIDGISNAIEIMESGRLDACSFDASESLGFRCQRAVHKHRLGDLEGAKIDLLFCMEQSQRHAASEPDDLTRFCHEENARKAAALLAKWFGQ